MSAFAEKFIANAPSFLGDLAQMSEMKKGALNDSHKKLKQDVKAGRTAALAAWKDYDSAKKSGDLDRIERAKADMVDAEEVRVAASAAAPAAYVAASCELTFGGWRCRCT